MAGQRPVLLCTALYTFDYAIVTAQVSKSASRLLQSQMLANSGDTGMLQRNMWECRTQIDALRSQCQALSEVGHHTCSNMLFLLAGKSALG